MYFNLENVITRINEYAWEIDTEKINIMEVCGTHTNSIAKYGIGNVISNKINLLSGPGCPVCVTNEEYIDAAIYLASKDNIIITFGDLMKVKGSNSTLSIEKSKGRNIQIIYSIADVIDIAKMHYPRDVVFLSIGFETTAPLIASLIKETYIQGIKNLFFLTSIKIMPPILEKIISTKNKNIHGIICPGNVSVITGECKFKFIYEKYNVPAVICGFEEKDILAGIYFLLRNIYRKDNNINEYGFKNLYRRWVSGSGNKKAQEIIKDVFEIGDAVWRGIGNIEKSGLTINRKYCFLDAVNKFNLHENIKEKNYKIKNKCRCTEVLLGSINPYECELFNNSCTPDNPQGACMVSREGSCAVHYKYSAQIFKYSGGK
ncbi:hydrogenase formation protein HypD [Clostridium rectalis]|uniref:hydrogenase formation protein HypD n=1 Tax=Clostridium rectalis TaxID=2040295 RepID=UPI000F63DD7E|nr:hydrogenase formation protein HypD [Clostridium rectalis]